MKIKEEIEELGCAELNSKESRKVPALHLPVFNEEESIYEHDNASEHKKKKVSRQLFVQNNACKDVAKCTLTASSEVYNNTYCRDWFQDCTTNVSTVQSDFENNPSSLTESNDSVNISSVSCKPPVSSPKLNSVMASLAKNHSKALEIKTMTRMYVYNFFILNNFKITDV